MEAAAAALNRIQTQLAKEREARAADLRQRITKAGGTEVFLKAEYPRVAALPGSLPDESGLVSSLASGEQPGIRWAEHRLRACQACSGGEGCLGSDFGPLGPETAGMKPDRWSDGHIAAVECEKWRTRLLHERLERLGLPPRFWDRTFEAYRPYNRSLERALEECRHFVSVIKRGGEPESLLLAGAWGTGKTHLAAATAIGLADVFQDKAAAHLRFEVTPKLLAMARASIKRSANDNPIETAMRIPVLILDDVGAEKVTEWVREQLFLLVNERYNYRRPTLVTTNCSMEELEDRIGQASVSRIMEMCQGVALEGEDWRKKGKVRSA